MLIPGETGLLFESGNTTMLTEQLLHVQSMSNAQLKIMGHAGHHFATTTFTVNRYLDSMCDLYQSLGVKFAQ
jgi:hypothetical protein